MSAMHWLLWQSQPWEKTKGVWMYFCPNILISALAAMPQAKAALRGKGMTYKCLNLTPIWNFKFCKHQNNGFVESTVHIWTQQCHIILWLLEILWHIFHTKTFWLRRMEQKKFQQVIIVRELFHRGHTTTWANF